MLGVRKLAKCYKLTKVWIKLLLRHFSVDIHDFYHEICLRPFRRNRFIEWTKTIALSGCTVKVGRVKLKD